MNNISYTNKKIIIIGGGFAGVKCALELSNAKIPNTKIVLISDKPHFEYHGALYRIVTGRNPLEVCIPLSEIFAGRKNVEVLRDKIVSIDIKNKKICGETDCRYDYDFLVLAIGGETEYYDIAGLKDYSYGFKSIHQAIKLKNHIHEMMDSKADLSNIEKYSAYNFIVVGAGASGTELAAELAMYTKKLAENHGVDPSLVSISLVDTAPRILPTLPVEMSSKIEERLRKLKVNIFLNQAVLKDNVDQVVFQNMNMNSRTLVWTAGVKANDLFKSINGLTLNKRGQVKVSDLNPAGFDNVFVLGDAAETKFSGMAQTALYDGKYAAKRIIKKIKGDSSNLPYQPTMPVYSIPVGKDWAATLINGMSFYGKLGWIFRRYLDLKVYLSILPFSKALTAFNYNKTLCETCEICNQREQVSSLF